MRRFLILTTVLVAAGAAFYFAPSHHQKNEPDTLQALMATACQRGDTPEDFAATLAALTPTSANASASKLQLLREIHAERSADDFREACNRLLDHISQ